MQNPASASDVIPSFLYGTAWKEERTQPLVESALEQGFRGIDTANQRRHYHEAAVGAAIQSVSERNLVSRADLFLQTKFTFQRGQDHRLPYNPKSPIADQVHQSFASSLQHLGTDVIDSYLLHAPTERTGLVAADWQAWRAMEEIQISGRVRLLGISNVTVEQLHVLCRDARVRPRVVQNRCYASLGWDRQMREFCRDNGIVYQGFSLLTANHEALAQPALAEIARRHGKTVAQIVFRFAIDVGMLPLTGTTNASHMREDLGALDFRLQPDEIRNIDTLAG